MSVERAKRTMACSQVLLAYCFAVLTALTPAGVRAAESQEVTIERGVPVKMRDSVTLRADICRPKAEGKFPVLLTRTTIRTTQSPRWGAPVLPTAADRGRPAGPAACGSARRRARILFAGIYAEHRSYGSNFARPVCQQLCGRHRFYRESG